MKIVGELPLDMEYDMKMRCVDELRRVIVRDEESRITDTIRNIIAHHFGLEEVSDDDHLIDDLGGDALDVVELVMDLEERFQIEISDLELERLSTVQDVCECVSRKLKVEI